MAYTWQEIVSDFFALTGIQYFTEKIVEIREHSQQKNCLNVHCTTKKDLPKYVYEAECKRNGYKPIEIPKKFNNK